MCNGDVRLQSAFCDYEGHCMVTGIANTRGDYRTNLIRKTVILDVDGQRLSTVNPIHVKFVGDNHNKLRDTFIMKFKLKEEDAARVSAYLIGVAWAKIILTRLLPSTLPATQNCTSRSVGELRGNSSR